jgi:hypothetical protein
MKNIGEYNMYIDELDVYKELIDRINYDITLKGFNININKSEINTKTISENIDILNKDCDYLFDK